MAEEPVVLLEETNPYLVVVRKSSKGHSQANPVIITAVQVDDYQFVTRRSGRPVYYLRFRPGVYMDIYTINEAGEEIAADPTKMNVDKYFENVNAEQVVDFISTPRTRAMWHAVLGKYGTPSGLRNPRFSQAVAALHRWPQIQTLALCGTFSDKGIQSIMYDMGNRYGRPEVFDFTKTLPNEICKIPRPIWNQLRNFSDSIDHLQQFINSCKEFMTDQDAYDFVNGYIVNSYGTVSFGKWNHYGYGAPQYNGSVNNTLGVNYRELKIVYEEGKYTGRELANYLFIQCLNGQGLNGQQALNLLADYYQACKEINMKPEKFSRQLHKDHDIATYHAGALAAAKNDTKFREIMTQYKIPLSYQNSHYDYVVTVPETPQDLIEEGNVLHHCVGSYITSVAEGRRIVLFLRNKHEKEVPLATLDMVPETHEITQAAGKNHRQLTAEERAFVNRYLKHLRGDDEEPCSSTKTPTETSTSSSSTSTEESSGTPS